MTHLVGINPPHKDCGNCCGAIYYYTFRYFIQFTFVCTSEHFFFYSEMKRNEIYNNKKKLMYFFLYIPIIPLA